jgi:hypothetical protein
MKLGIPELNANNKVSLNNRFNIPAILDQLASHQVSMAKAIRYSQDLTKLVPVLHKTLKTKQDRYRERPPRPRMPEEAFNVGTSRTLVKSG